MTKSQERLKADLEASVAAFHKARELLRDHPDHDFDFSEVWHFATTGVPPDIRRLATTDDIDPQTGALRDFEAIDPRIFGGQPAPQDVTNAEWVFAKALREYVRAHNQFHTSMSRSRRKNN